MNPIAAEARRLARRTRRMTLNEWAEYRTEYKRETHRDAEPAWLGPSSAFSDREVTAAMRRQWRYEVPEAQTGRQSQAVRSAKLPPLSVQVPGVGCIDRASGLFRHPSRITSRNDALDVYTSRSSTVTVSMRTSTSRSRRASTGSSAVAGAYVCAEKTSRCRHQKTPG